jgi:hypothetical protein
LRCQYGVVSLEINFVPDCNCVFLRRNFAFRKCRNMEINCKYEIVYILLDSFAAEIVCAYFHDFFLQVFLLWFIIVIELC